MATTYLIGQCKRPGHGFSAERTLSSLDTEFFILKMATHSSVLAWRIPGMGEPRGLPSMGSHRVGHE